MAWGFRGCREVICGEIREVFMLGWKRRLNVRSLVSILAALGGAD